MECCHVWAVAPNCILVVLNKLQKWIYKIAGPSLATSLEHLANCGNVARLRLFYSCYFGRYLSELAVLVPLPHFHGRSTCYSNRIYDFSVIIPRCYKNVYVNSFFSLTARIWKYLPVECFPLTYSSSQDTLRLLS